MLPAGGGVAVCVRGQQPFGATAYRLRWAPGDREGYLGSSGGREKSTIPQVSVEFLGIFLLSSPTFPP